MASPKDLAFSAPRDYVDENFPFPLVSGIELMQTEILSPFMVYLPNNFVTTVSIMKTIFFFLELSDCHLYFFRSLVYDPTFLKFCVDVNVGLIN